MKTTLYASLMMTWLLATSCGDLSSEAKQIVGNYIIPEISQTEPVMELKRDATCVVRAIKPGVLKMGKYINKIVKNKITKPYIRVTNDGKLK